MEWETGREVKAYIPTSGQRLKMCYQCGNCSAICPVGISPRRFIGYLRWGLKYDDEFWLCLQCKLCDEFCPRNANPSEVMSIFKSTSVERGEVPSHIGEYLMNVYRRRNPWGYGRMKRFDWMKRVEVPVGVEAEYIWYVGCSSLDPRASVVIEKIAKILNYVGFDYTVLKEEGCCGNDVKRVGEEGLFEMLMDENVKLFRKYNVRKIFTHSPHCYNTFKNDYMLRYSNIEVKHFLEILADVIEDLDLKEVRKVVTYHDSCFLGRYNGMYDLPRDILERIPSLKLVEMENSMRRSVCCGGGCGNVVVGYRGAVQPSILRVKEALKVDADVIAVSCPFCKIMLEEAVKSLNCDIEVLDVVELIYKALGDGL